MTPALRLTGLSKSYGAVTAVAALDLCVDPGVFLGLVGPNGAGKTTALLAIGTAPALATLVAGQLAGSETLRWLGAPVAVLCGLGIAVRSSQRSVIRLERQEVAMLATLVAASR